MKKQKLLALALSAISTGILISCAKPADNANNDEKTDKTDNKQKTDNTQATAEKTPTQENKAEKNASQVKPLKLNEKQTTAYLQHVSKDIITPLYQNSAKQSQALHDKTKELCQSGSVSSNNLKQLREQWLKLAQAWAKAEAINFGVATENMAHLYINYFPDERGLVHKSVVNLVKDNPNLDPKQFADESAIVQGVPALEDILYTNDSLNQAQCNFVLSASAELNRRLDEFAKQWQENGNKLLDTENTTTGLNQYFNSLLFHIENLKSTGLGKPLGLISHKKGHLPAHTAGENKAIIQAKMDILKQALEDKKLTELFADKSDIQQKMLESISQIEQQLAKMPNNIGKAPQTEQQALYDDLTKLTKHIKRQLMPLLSVQVGFNSTDGD